jgi:hypothetical protein
VRCRALHYIVILVKDFQFYADIAREFPIMTPDPFFSQTIDDERDSSMIHLTPLNLDEFS